MSDRSTSNPFLNKLWREPVFHFFLLAVVIFILYGIASLNRGYVLELDQREIDARIFMQEMTTGEELGQEQREFITARYVEEQMLVREALDMGLDNDARIHDMLAQKMLHVLSGDIIQPTEQELQNYYQTNLERYRTIPAIDVMELVFDSREDLPPSVMELLEQGGDAESLLQLTPSNSEPLPNVNRLDLANIFSEEFAEQVFAAQPGAWSGPFVSNRGQHWLQITDIIPAQLPEMAEIRDRVRLEWINQEEDARLQVEISRLFDKYSVVISDGAATEE